MTPSSAEGGGLALPLRGVNTGAPKIRIEDASGDTVAYVYYCFDDYGKPIKDTLAVARVEALVRGANRAPVYDELLSALRFADNEVNVARGVLWAKADAVEHQPDGERHARQLRRSAEKLDEVSRRCREAIDAALSHAEQVKP